MGLCPRFGVLSTLGLLDALVREGRLLVCGICGKGVWVCRSCDHGRRYCSTGCSLEARRLSCRQAAKKFRESVAGKQAAARRQRERYARLRREREIKESEQNLTHHRFAPPEPSPIIPALTASGDSSGVEERKPDDPETRQGALPAQERSLTAPAPTGLNVDGALPRCHFCGTSCRRGEMESTQHKEVSFHAAEEKASPT